MEHDKDNETEMHSDNVYPLLDTFRCRSSALSKSSSTELSISDSMLQKAKQRLSQGFDLEHPISLAEAQNENDSLPSGASALAIGNGEEGEGGEEGSMLYSSEVINSDLTTPTDNEDKEENQRYSIINGTQVGTRDSGGPKFTEDVHSDGVGIFAKFRGTKDKDTEVREDPKKFYLVDAAEISKESPILDSRSPELLPMHHPRQPQRRPNTIPRKTGSNPALSTTEAYGDAIAGKLNRQQRERERILSRPFQKLPPPFEHSEHHDMHTSLKIPIAIYEKEPTSLIAYTLSSREYAQEYWGLVEGRHAGLSDVKSRPNSPKSTKKPTDLPPPQPPPPSKTATLKQAYQELRKKGPLTAMNVLSGLTISTSDRSDRSDLLDKSNEDSKRLEAALSSKTGPTSMPATDQTVGEDGEGFRWNTTGESSANSGSSKTGHISLEFTGPDSSRFFCKVYFAEEFQHLRELIFPSGEDKFIRSLSRCVKFDAKGGKSRSTFCKVIDDRFIMKQIKSVEISSFEQIAPQYFEHVTSALEQKRPLVLAKILGVYTIGYRNTTTGSSKRLDVIIMENLLYGQKSSKVFDLKGSMRSRYIDPSKDSSNDVLLDENYLNHICYTPVYTHPHSKAALMKAIQEDTEFLARNAIMDYSLLTCIDDQNGELVVGIIDYVRTFTLDKRLEMYIKKTAGRVLPTVVYPELYCKRFCEAMDRYFTAVPDKWTGLGADFKL